MLILAHAAVEGRRKVALPENSWDDSLSVGDLLEICFHPSEGDDGQWNREETKRKGKGGR